jgi:hypothetical protein
MDENLVIPYRRTLRGGNLNHWVPIKKNLLALSLSIDLDSISWSLNHNNFFSTKSVYQLPGRNLARSHNKWIGKARIPLKIKVFL